MRLTPLHFAKYWKRYVDRELYGKIETIKYQTGRGWRVTGRDRKFNYGLERPWTDTFRYQNLEEEYKEIPREPVKQQNIFKGDRVRLLVGPDKGKDGIVTGIVRERNWVLVGGLNCKYETGPTKTFPDGPVICQKVSEPLMLSQVSLVDPKFETPTEVVWRYTDEGEKVRVCKRSGTLLTLPLDAYEVDGLKNNPKNYNPGSKDTDDKSVRLKTYKPSAKTFEEEINESMGIKEPRKRAKTYWY